VAVVEDAQDPVYRDRPLNGRRTVVPKFGGTSLAGPARIRMAARRVEAHVRRGRHVVAVVSAGGGSDTSAVALAAALGAACHIVTDVVAIHDRDPHEFADARPIRELEHAQLLQLANAGARVVHPAAAFLAASSGVTLRVYHCRSPFAGSGTVIRNSFSTAHASNGGVS
jgi:aspartokinase